MLEYYEFRPDRTGGDLLADLAERHAGGRLTIKSAWASLAGVAILRDAVAGKINDFRVIVSGNNATTELEAVYALRSVLNAEVRVVYEGDHLLWHVKEWLFEGGDRGSDSATLVVGSMNLTVGGLRRNTESVSVYSGRTSPGGDMEKALGSWQETWEALVAPTNPYVHDAGDDEILEKLYKDGLLVSAARASRERKADRATRTATGRRPKTVPVRSRPHVDVPPVPDVELPFELDENVETASRSTRAVQPAAAAVATYDLVFVRTLTRNDVAKLRREQTGTFEPDIGETPRDLNPTFWGWPTDYATVVPREKPRDQWETRARFFSSQTGPEGVEIDVVFWHRKERPEHAAEHRFRPEARIKDYVPPDFDEQGVVIFQRVDDAAVDFELTLISSSEPDYNRYSAVASNQNPAHRYGYAERSTL